MKNNRCPLKGIKYVSFYESSGYGSAAKCYLRGLMKTPVPTTWTPWTPMIRVSTGGVRYRPFLGKNIRDPELDTICNRKIVYDTVVIHLVPEYYPLQIRSEPRKRIVGYTVWETDKIPGHWVTLLNAPDAILVPTKWNKEIFEKEGVTKPIHVIPHIARGSKPRPFLSGESFWGAREDDFVFYTIGDWTTRKAIGKAVQCYLDTFTAEDSTIFLIKTSKFDFTKGIFERLFFPTQNAIKKLLKMYKNPARIGLITDHLTDRDILRLHSRGNCYISLCRSEGWGLGAFDAASFGKPVIITGYGGQVEYLPRQWAYLVDYHLTQVVDKPGKKSYSEDQNWAEPDVSQASQLLRHVFENKEKANLRGCMLSKHIQKNFNETNIIEKLLQVLEQS